MFPLRGLCGHPFTRTVNKFVSHAINYIQSRPLALAHVLLELITEHSLPDVGYIYSFFFLFFSHMVSFRFGRYCPHKYLRNKFFNLVALIAQMTLPFIRTQTHTHTCTAIVCDERPHRTEINFTIV